MNSFKKIGVQKKLSELSGMELSGTELSGTGTDRQ